jgi:hypothetical protein
MIKHRWIRLTLGTVLGGFAGLSLTSSILPMVLSFMGLGEDLFFRWQLSGYAAHAALLFAVGGWAAVRTDIPMAAAAVLGVVGAIGGVVLSFWSFGSEIDFLLACGIGGGFYGFLGGLLLGTVLRSPGPQEISS